MAYLYCSYAIYSGLEGVIDLRIMGEDYRNDLSKERENREKVQTIKCREYCGVQIKRI